LMSELITEMVGGEAYQYYPLGKHVVRRPNVAVLLAMLVAVAYTNMKDAHCAELDESKKIDPEHHPESAANPAPEDNGSTGA